MRLGIGPGSHDLSDFVVGHFVSLNCAVVHKHSAANLICNCHRDQSSPGNSEYLVNGETESSNTAELVVTTKVVQGHRSSSKSIEGEAEGQALGTLQLGLREKVSVGVSLDIHTRLHRCLRHFVFLFYLL